MGLAKSLWGSAKVLSGVLLCIAASIANSETHPLITVAQQMAQGEYNPQTVSYYLGQNIDRYTDLHGRVTPELQEALYWIEREIFSHSTEESIKEFQRSVARVGGRVRGKILLPKEDISFWMLNLTDSIDEGLREKLLIPQDKAEVLKQFPFGEFHTQAKLSEEADVVIIGAGLTGANVMFHLIDAMKKGLKVVMLDSNLADGASFRNGGNYENLPENFLADYQGLREERVKYLRLTRPQMIEAEIQKMATEQADWILQWCASNVNLIGQLFEEKGIDAFASRKGWVRMAGSIEEEAAIRQEVERAQKLGLDFEYWDKARVKKELKIDVPFGARMARKSGNYHPGRLITQILKLGIKEGLEFHTQTRVTALETDGDKHVVKTSHGTIRAQHVVVGTNAFTRDLLPQVAPVIHPFQSHLATWEHVPLPSNDLSATASWTWNLGDGYGHFRWETIYVDGKKQLRATWINGGGTDAPAPTTVLADLERNPQVFQEILANVNRLHPETIGQPPSRFWTGLMGFTPDRMPLVGALSKKLWIAAGYNGYGGSWSLRAGYEIAQMILSGHGTELYNENYLSPNRFFNGTAVNPLGRPFTNDDPCAVALSKKKEPTHDPKN